MSRCMKIVGSLSSVIERKRCGSNRVVPLLVQVNSLIAPGQRDTRGH